ncbi:MAG: hypothetical protein NTW21_21255, partial [Verrucomicrobia bacterium]|nr:hypothetical protein [Verrucomicrobiota bacterium]
SAGEPRMMVPRSHAPMAYSLQLQRPGKPALHADSPAEASAPHHHSNIQLPMIKQEQDMTPHRHCCHPQTHARMIHEPV